MMSKKSIKTISVVLICLLLHDQSAWAYSDSIWTLRPKAVACGTEKAVDSITDAHLKNNLGINPYYIQKEPSAFWRFVSKFIRRKEERYRKRHGNDILGKEEAKEIIKREYLHALDILGIASDRPAVERERIRMAICETVLDKTYVFYSASDALERDNFVEDRLTDGEPSNYIGGGLVKSVVPKAIGSGLILAAEVFFLTMARTYNRADNFFLNSPIWLKLLIFISPFILYHIRTYFLLKRVIKDSQVEGRAIVDGKSKYTRIRFFIASFCSREEQERELASQAFHEAVHAFGLSYFRLHYLKRKDEHLFALASLFLLQAGFNKERIVDFFLDRQLPGIWFRSKIRNLFMVKPALLEDRKKERAMRLLLKIWPKNKSIDPEDPEADDEHLYFTEEKAMRLALQAADIHDKSDPDATLRFLLSSIIEDKPEAAARRPLDYAATDEDIAGEIEMRLANAASAETAGPLTRNAGKVEIPIRHLEVLINSSV